MSWSLIANTGQGGTINGVTTGAINTSGANLIVLSICWYKDVTADGTLTDSKSNTWTPLTKRTSGELTNRLFYSVSPTVGSGHTFDYSGLTIAPSMEVQAWSGAAASPFDQESGVIDHNTHSIGTSRTPSEDNCLVISGLGFNDNSGGAVSDTFATFTISDTVAYSSGNHEGGSMAYQVQTSAALAVIAWDITNNAVDLATSMAVFKMAAAGGGGKPWIYYAQQRRLRQPHPSRWERRGSIWLPREELKRKAS